MGKLQSIENALVSIDQGKFQNLCDSYLILRNENYLAFSRTGSQIGKQKTVKGTPDSFLLLPSNKFIFVEYSTNVTAGVSKIEADIRKCLDEKKTGISKKQLSEIIICLNFNLDSKEIERLDRLLIDTNIRLTVETLDSLALQLCLHHHNLVHEYLELPLDTGQIVSIDQFVNEYNRKGSAISTPLNNPFVQRESEQKELAKAINHSDFVIVTGPPGVGKTKLCIETIDSFQKKNLSYQTYCVSYKSHTLLEDLYLHIDKDKDYILFVDDANRIDAFSQIIGFYQIVRSGHLKIVITVRDYAFVEIRDLVHEFGFNKVNVPRLTDEQIVQIIKSEPFKILNPDYQDPIKSIADGNPRLAIMASLLAKKEQDPRALSDVSDLFEKYYATFIRDQAEFASELNIKCLGLIAFFYTIPYKDRKVTTSILDNFGIGYDSFIDIIDKLDKLELVEIQFEHVKIPEQNLSTYFFYKAFIQDQLLSFETLLLNYFQTNQRRFKDCVIPANNTFGSQRVMDRLQPFLKIYWGTIKSDWDKGYKFLNTFWFYMEEETLTFVLDKVNTLPSAHETDYEIFYEPNNFKYKNDEIIDLLGDFLCFDTTMFDALELLFEYVRKKPKHLPELINKIREVLTFDRDDWKYGFNRQFILFQYLIKGLKSKDKLLARTFFELIKSFLGFKFDHSKGGRNRSIVMYQFHLPDKTITYQFRSLVWDNLFIHFSEYPIWAFESLESYSKTHPDVIKEIMQKDIPYLLKIINQYLNPENFEHCRYVQKQIRWCKRNEVEHKKFQGLKDKFINPLYKLYLTLDWDSFRDKDSFEFDDYKEYEKIKEKQIRDSIKLFSKADVEQFYYDFVYLRGLATNKWKYKNVLSIVIDETVQNDKELGYYFLELIIEQGNEVELIPYTVFRNMLNDVSHSERLWKLLNKRGFKSQSEWKIAFFAVLDDSLIKQEHAAMIIKTVQEILNPITISFNEFERYLQFDSKLFQKAVGIIYKRNEEEGTRILVWDDLFHKHFDHIEDSLELTKKFYIQQRRVQSQFDFDFKGIEKILRKDSYFMVEYVAGIYIEDKREFIDDHKGLGFVWDLPDAEQIVTQIFELVREKARWSGIREHYCNTFFKEIGKQHIDRADNYLIDFIKSNYTDPKKINEVVDIVERTRKELFESVLLTYVGLNQNVEDFSKIQWIGSGGIYSGGVIIGDMRAASWKNVLSIVEKSELRIKILPIKKRINEMIEGELRSGDWERRQRFLERF